MINIHVIGLMDMFISEVCHIQNISAKYKDVYGSWVPRGLNNVEITWT